MPASAVAPPSSTWRPTGRATEHGWPSDPLVVLAACAGHALVAPPPGIPQLAVGRRHLAGGQCGGHPGAGPDFGPGAPGAGAGAGGRAAAEPGPAGPGGPPAGADQAAPGGRA